MKRARERIILALDTHEKDYALEIVDRFDGLVDTFKVGLELFIATGPSILEELRRRGHSIFLDLKLHDIPNTVAAAVRTAASLGVDLLTVHAFGGPAMLTAARDALAGLDSPPQLLAVTVLTSMDQPQLAAIGAASPPAAQVELLARLGLASGINGFVCSAEEVANLRALTGPAGLLVTPGIRPAGSAAGDQKRIATPAGALRNGASYLVVGRPITQAANPAAAATAILNEMEQG